ncbi:MAG: hypothetical protein ACAI38_15025 [Myxococcota bacterium]|nr:hypothetical protein [Myxococcota bacterium]
MYAPLLLALAVAADPGTPSAVFVTTEVDAELQQRILRVTDWNNALDRTVLDMTEAQRRLTDLPAPRIVDVAAMRRTLETATDRDASFDTAGALALRREVLQAYDNSVLPNVELQVLAATASQDIAASELAEGHEKEALEAARTAQRRFPNVPLDSKRHPPQVAQLFKRAAVELKRAPTGELTITSNQPARVMADGIALGKIDRKLTVKLPQGTWRIWLADDNGTSLQHHVAVASTPVTVDIDLALESSLSWTTVPLLRCQDTCDALLARLAARVRTDEAVGLSLSDDPGAPATGLFVRTDGGTTTSKPVVALADLTPTLATTAQAQQPDRFSAWSLVPFGVGQFAQKRYIAGSIYGAVQAGLLAWNIAEASRGTNEDAAAESDRRKRQNLSAGLLVGAIVASITEAIVVDAMSD